MNKNSGTLGKRLLVLAAASLVSSAAFALPEVTDTEGWSGEVGFGAGYFDIKSNTIAGSDLVDLDNDRLTTGDLNGANQASSRDTAFPVINGEVRWTLGGGNQFFLGSDVEDPVTLDGAVQIGYRKRLQENGTIQLGVLLNRLVPQQVYEDPYQTGSKRDDTDYYRTGLRFQWDKILGSQFEWQVTYSRYDVDNDNAGEVFLPGGGQTIPGGGFLTQSEVDDLDRDGEDFDTKVSYLFDLGGGHSIRPLIGYRDFQADGNATTFDAGQLRVTYAYRGEKLDFISSVAASSRNYDETDPVFNDDRDSDNLAINVTAFYDMPWVDDDRWRVFGNALWGEVDSDVNFYDIDTFSVAVGAQYKFGNQ